MTSGPPPMCLYCKRLDPTRMVCQAYPEGIPEEIIFNQWDHRVQQAGDHGLQFVPKDPAEKPMPWWPTHKHEVTPS